MPASCIFHHLSSRQHCGVLRRLHCCNKLKQQGQLFMENMTHAFIVAKEVQAACAFGQVQRCAQIVCFSSLHALMAHGFRAILGNGVFNCPIIFLPIFDAISMCLSKAHAHGAMCKLGQGDTGGQLCFKELEVDRQNQARLPHFANSCIAMFAFTCWHDFYSQTHFAAQSYLQHQLVDIAHRYSKIHQPDRQELV